MVCIRPSTPKNSWKDFDKNRKMNFGSNFTANEKPDGILLLQYQSQHRK